MRLKLVMLVVLMSGLVSNCSHTQPKHDFDIKIVEDKACMSKADFKLLYDAYTEYYGIK